MIIGMPSSNTISRTRPSLRRPTTSGPVWELAELFPVQGDWDEWNYKALIDSLESHPVIELYNGRLEILPMPTEWHQFILQFFYRALDNHALLKAPGPVL